MYRRKNANPAVIGFTDAAAGLSANVDGVITFFNKSAFIEDEDTIGGGHIVVKKTMILI